MRNKANDAVAFGWMHEKILLIPFNSFHEHYLKNIPFSIFAREENMIVENDKTHAHACVLPLSYYSGESQTSDVPGQDGIARSQKH